MLPLGFTLIFRFALLSVLILASIIPCAAQQPPAAGPSPEGLGRINFPNSCTLASQPAILKGIAQLHSFQYAAAEKAFAEVPQADPHCAMAYWGLAMSSYRPLWDGADEKALIKGRGYLEKIKKDWPASKREREYIDAIGVIFSDNRRLGDERITGYSRALAEICKHYPDDGEAQAFFALSLLALPGRGDDLETRKQAIAILSRLSAAQPEHPGAVHYLIHAADTPELASQGLAAARRYARIAPASSHALHMPAHIFVRLGLWRESIDSNLAAAAAAAQATEQHMGEAQYQLHAMDFLNYSYMQIGEEAKARQIIEDLNKVPGRTAEATTNVRVNFTTRNLMELHRWKEALALQPEGDAQDQQMIYVLRTVAAARIGDARAADENLKNLKKAFKQDRSRNRRLEDHRRQVAEAWVEYAKGKQDKAVKKMRAAADTQDRDDPGPFGVTAREMLADMLMELHQPAPALTAYETVLKLAPNRFNPLYGAAAAAEMAGDASKAKSYYSKLRENCPPQADREELQKAKMAAAGSN
jgi:tetratricopeptide (TPR) repeat protein